MSRPCKDFNTNFSNEQTVNELKLYPEDVSYEYILCINELGFGSIINDSRTRAATQRTQCQIEITPRILNKRVNLYRWMKYAIIKITGPNETAVNQCLKLLEKHFPVFLHRKEYNRRANVTIFTNDIDIPDNAPGSRLVTRSGSTMSYCRGLNVKSPYELNERREANRAPWKILNSEKKGRYFSTLLCQNTTQPPLPPHQDARNFQYKPKALFGNNDLNYQKLDKNTLFGSVGTLSDYTNQGDLHNTNPRDFKKKITFDNDAAWNKTKGSQTLGEVGGEDVLHTQLMQESIDPYPDMTPERKNASIYKSEEVNLTNAPDFTTPPSQIIQPNPAKVNLFQEDLNENLQYQGMPIYSHKYTSEDKRLGVEINMFSKSGFISNANEPRNVNKERTDFQRNSTTFANNERMHATPYNDQRPARQSLKSERSFRDSKFGATHEPLTNDGYEGIDYGVDQEKYAERLKTNVVTKQVGENVTVKKNDSKSEHCSKSSQKIDNVKFKFNSQYDESQRGSEKFNPKSLNQTINVAQPRDQLDRSSFKRISDNASVANARVSEADGRGNKTKSHIPLTRTSSTEVVKYMGNLINMEVPKSEALRSSLIDRDKHLSGALKRSESLMSAPSRVYTDSISGLSGMDESRIITKISHRKKSDVEGLDDWVYISVETTAPGLSSLNDSSKIKVIDPEIKTARLSSKPLSLPSDLSLKRNVVNLNRTTTQNESRGTGSEIREPNIQPVSGVSKSEKSSFYPSIETPSGQYVSGINRSSTVDQDQSERSHRFIEINRDVDIIRAISNRLLNPTKECLIVMFDGQDIFSTGNVSVVFRPAIDQANRSVGNCQFFFETNEYFVTAESRFQVDGKTEVGKKIDALVRTNTQFTGQTVKSKKIS